MGTTLDGDSQTNGVKHQMVVYPIVEIKCYISLSEGSEFDIHRPHDPRIWQVQGIDVFINRFEMHCQTWHRAGVFAFNRQFAGFRGSTLYPQIPSGIRQTIKDCQDYLIAGERGKLQSELNERHSQLRFIPGLPGFW